jgi:hypothetical protein
MYARWPLVQRAPLSGRANPIPANEHSPPASSATIVAFGGPFLGSNAAFRNAGGMKSKRLEHPLLHELRDWGGEPSLKCQLQQHVTCMAKCVVFFCPTSAGI